VLGAVDGDARVVHEDVEPAAPRSHLLERRPYGVAVGDIQSHTSDLPGTRGVQVSRHLDGAAGIASGQHDVIAEAGELAADLQTDPSVPSGDDRDALLRAHWPETLRSRHLAPDARASRQ
jgi:hypothetical protein